MRILYSPEFMRRYKKLPLEVQKKAEEKEVIFAFIEKSAVKFYAIGDHSIYKKL